MLELTDIPKMEEIAKENRNRLEKNKENHIERDNDINLDKYDNKKSDEKNKENKREDNGPSKDDVERENLNRQRDKIDIAEQIVSEMDFDPIGEFETVILDTPSPYNLYGNEARDNISSNDIEELLRNNGQNR